MISCSSLTKSFSGRDVLKELTYQFENTGFFEEKRSDAD